MSLYSRYLGLGTLSQNGMQCRGTCVMCLRAQSLPLTYLYRCLSQCVGGGRLISTQLSPASVQFPVPNPAKRKTGRDAGFGDKKLQPWLAHASLFTHFTKSLSCVEFVSPSAGETCSSSRVAEERRRRTERLVRRCRCAAIMPRDPTFLSSGTLSEVEVQALRLGVRIPPARALASGMSAMYHWARVTRVALAQWGHP